MPRSNRSPAQSVTVASGSIGLPARSFDSRKPRLQPRGGRGKTGSRGRPGGGRRSRLPALGHGVAALVQQAVVVAAELDEVVEARRAAVRPVLDVVRVDGACVGAAREAAAAVADWSARRSAGGMLRVLRPTLSGLPARSSSGTIAASHASRRAVSAAIGVPSASSRLARAVAQGGGVDVDDHLVAIAAAAPRARRPAACRPSGRARPRAARQARAIPRKRRRRPRFRGSALERRRARSRALPRKRASTPGDSAESLSRVHALLQRGQHDRALLRGQPRVQHAASRRRRGPSGPSAPVRRPQPPAIARDHAAVRAHDPLQLRRRRVAREREQLLLAPRPPPRA